MAGRRNAARAEQAAFTDTLTRLAGGGVAFIVVVGLVFWGLGAIRGDGDPVIDGSGDPIAAPSTEPSEAVSPSEAASDPAPEETDSSEGELDPAALDPAAESPEPTPEPTSAPTPTASPEPPEPSPTAQPSGSIAASEISVQVLDAVHDDGGKAASDLFARLRDDGYRAVAKNSSVKVYEKTTVFYSPGAQAKAEQVARQYGFSVVEPKPDNLVDTVDLHIVVGKDYA